MSSGGLNFEGRVVLVGGGSSSLGRAVVELFIERGARVIAFLASDEAEMLDGAAITVYGRD